MEKPIIGGQAVVEGVMMRGCGKVATATRESNGNINLEVKPLVSLMDKYPVLKLPILRGVVSLLETLSLGVGVIMDSQNAAAIERGEEPIGEAERAATVIFAMVMSVGIFLLLPTLAAKIILPAGAEPFMLNLVEGIFRLMIFVAYLSTFKKSEESRRIYAYHGAEHKTIFCYEADAELTPENVRKFSRFHPRCGTSLLLVVMAVSIVVFALAGWTSLWLRILEQIILLPLIAGISFEIIRFSARSKNKLVQVATLPGLWLQRITTNEPDDAMLEVAIASLKGVLPKEG